MADERESSQEHRRNRHGQRVAMALGVRARHERKERRKECEPADPDLSKARLMHDREQGVGICGGRHRSDHAGDGKPRPCQRAQKPDQRCVSYRRAQPTPYPHRRSAGGAAIEGKEGEPEQGRHRRKMQGARGDEPSLDQRPTLKE
jgi:hypothetical protein